MTLYFTTMASPIGNLKLVADENALVAIEMRTESTGRLGLIEMPSLVDHKVLYEARRQLEEYFSGTRTMFEIPLKPVGTAFQVKVWKALEQIPFGVTISYGELAKRIGSPKSSRAVGNANRVNPIPIIVPCHRVIGANGQLVGFAGGLEVKEALLKLERKDVGRGAVWATTDRIPLGKQSRQIMPGIQSVLAGNGS